MITTMCKDGAHAPICPGVFHDARDCHCLCHRQPERRPERDDGRALWMCQGKGGFPSHNVANERGAA